MTILGQEHRAIIGDPTEWTVQMSTKTFSEPCALCNSTYIRIPYEIFTATGHSICYACCKKLNPPLKSLLNYYLENIQPFVGEVYAERTATPFVFGVGVPVEQMEDSRLLDFLKMLATQLEYLACLSLFYVNMDATRFRGKMYVRRTAQSAHSELTEHALIKIIDNYSFLASYVRYFYVWNIPVLGKVGIDTSYLAEDC